MLFRENTDFSSLFHRCCKLSERVYSTKWMLHGKLLEGQVLAKMGNNVDAQLALKQCLSLECCEDSTVRSTMSYVRALSERVSLSKDTSLDCCGDTRGSENPVAASTKSFKKLKKRVKHSNLIESSSSDGQVIFFFLVSSNIFIF